jgi:hypothetical protein
VTVTVSGPPGNVAALKAGDLVVYVRLQDLAAEEVRAGHSAPYKEAVHVDVPLGMGLKVDQVQPEAITVILKKPAE